MFRCLHRRAAWSAVFAATSLLHGPVLAAGGGAARDARAPAPVKSEAKARKPAPAKQASPATKPGGRTQPKGKAPASTEPKATEKRATAPKRTEKRASAESNAAPKRAIGTKQSDTGKGALENPAGARSAKSLGNRKNDDHARAPEPGLKPPGGARPGSVRSVGSRLVIPSQEVAEQSLAFRYANLDDAEVVAELERRGIPWQPASPPLPGVRTPIRLTGPLHGVTIHSTLPERERRTSVFEILDGRLALALDDFCALLARHDVVELVHYTMYRPPGELPPDLNKQIRHPAGLAIDVGALRKADGRWLAIGPHWPSDIGAKTCGEGAREHWSRPGREIVSIACEAADLRMFHFILTPHFDAAHADHLHLEIKPDTRWFLVN
ncbi:MAG TPA: extensin family protein [Polyangiaceae bacterium]